MTELSPEEKREIVRQELHQLVKAKYISLTIAAKVVKAHEKYYKYLPKVHQIKQELEAKKQPTPEPQVNIQKGQGTETIKVKPSPETFRKPKKSAKEIRDRNITWGLNLGVILLLLGGLVLATSTWDTLGDWTKTGLIASISMLFFSLAWFANRILHIQKTAFAFLVLGNLFLPIVIISAGYFGLFGDYLSFFGEGKYLFGVIGITFLIPIYIYFAYRLQSRLFVWFSYVSISVFVGLLFGALYLPIDGFYLAVMLYNALFIFSYGKLKSNPKISLFSKEFIPFIQANLILSTLLMLVFYDHEVMYSFNLLLTAVIYFSMIFVTNHKSYHFVFTAMLMYGAYQLVENSIVEGVGEIAYALLGALFLVLPKIIKNASSLQKSFHITSAIVSLLAFLYISVEGILLRMGEGSFVLLLAYIIIALNFAYLAKTTTNTLFTYLSPIFIISALYELALLGKDWFGYESSVLPFFILTFLFFTIGGCIGLSWQQLKTSTRDISSISLLVSLLVGFYESSELVQSIMLVLLSVLAVLMYRYEHRNSFIQFATWIHGIMLGIAVVVFYRYLVDNTFTLADIPLQYVAGGLVVLAISYVWQALRHEKFAINSFYVAQFFYGIGILLSFDFSIESVTRACIILGGVGMAYLLYWKTRWKGIEYLVSILALVFYFTAQVVMHDSITQVPEIIQWFEAIIGSLLLLGIGLGLSKKDVRLSKAFYWTGQIYLPFALIQSFLVNGADALWTAFVVVIVYSISVAYVKKEWQVKTFFYAGLTSFWISLQMVFGKLEWYHENSYTFLITSLLLFGGWVFSSKVWKKRILYYFLPFSMIGMLMFVLGYRFDFVTLVVTFVYGLLVLYVLHRIKWDAFATFPLILLYGAVNNLDTNVFVLGNMPIQFPLFGIALAVAGRVLYKTLYGQLKNYYHIDWYSIFAFLVFLHLYYFSDGSLFIKIIPGILIAALLFINRNRVPNVSSKWPAFAAFVYLLQPYYALLGHFELPPLFEREFYVLPWIVVVIGLRRYVVKENKSMINNIQWAVLVIVAILLVQDGLASNTIYDALIVGVLSLVSLLAGMAFQIKSYFFVGTGVLLFNVFMQTRPYWGDVPWYGYLIIAGSILVAVASYYEWQRKRNTEGKETLVTKFKKHVVERMKKWD